MVELGAADVLELAALPSSVGWHDTVEDWRVITACARVFGHRDGERLLSCGALVDFGEVAWVAKMVVRPEAQRRGLGAAVLERVLGAARADAVVGLVATAMGAPVYARAGFVEVGRVCKMMTPEGLGPGPGPRGVAALAGQEAAVRAIDRAVFGADRGRMLGPRMAQARRGVVVRVGAAVVGWGLAVAQRELTVIGPVHAPDAEVALALVGALAEGAPGRLRIDVPAEHAGLVAALAARGFLEVDRQAVMTLDARALPGQRARLFALASQAFG